MDSVAGFPPKLVLALDLDWGASFPLSVPMSLISLGCLHSHVCTLLWMPTLMYTGIPALASQRALIPPVNVCALLDVRLLKQPLS